jgi:hypothetical protein
MTTLLEAARKALALNAWTHFGECRATDGPIPTPAEVDAALRQAIEQAQQAQPVAWMWKDGSLTTDPDYADGTWQPLYTSPPPRQPWVGLDEEDWDAILYEAGTFGMVIRVTEDKLKEKNT